VWGEVPDVRPWLAGADIALVPLEIARGVQNKVLEAMAMNLPVVLTGGAATGIGAQHGEHFLVADEDQGLVDAIAALAADPAMAGRLGQQARRFVVNQLGWAATLAPLAGLLAPVAGGQRHAA